MSKKYFFVYMMASGKRGTIYIGITSDLLSRVRRHKDHQYRDSFTDRDRSAPSSPTEPSEHWIPAFAGMTAERLGHKPATIGQSSPCLLTLPPPSQAGEKCPNCCSNCSPRKSQRASSAAPPRT